MKTVMYIRVSSKDQNLDRQLEEARKLGIEEKYIYEDKASGKDFERIGYQYMKKGLEKGDLLIVKSLDRFGRKYEEIISEWNQITKVIGADIKVLDMEMLDTTKNKDLLGNFISDLVLQLLSFVAENERDTITQRRTEGIAIAQAKGVKFGRPVIDVDEDRLKELYEKVKNEEMTNVEAMQELQLSKATYYRRIKELKSEGRS